ncbi:hypothetical protein PITCH_A1100044 [uncultured Desulfobacterium sp.]|uniref:Uncharacterized protein n=1 Tax=uncultured Desulfobacterium sp. TaxID=201089 RepID=A0A445MR69_9BACT|nr:hypothetical protein PITCH_A1100044 [uncultured Desulfobacterium sp.]
MTSLNLHLVNRRFIHEISKEYSERTLIFDVSLGSTKLRVKGKGYVTEGTVRIHEGEPQLASITYFPGWTNLDLAFTQQQCFEVETHVPANTFQTLLSYNERNTSFMLVLEFLPITTTNLQPGLPAGPFGYEVDWDIEKQHNEQASNIQFILESTHKHTDMCKVEFPSGDHLLKRVKLKFGLGRQ